MLVVEFLIVELTSSWTPLDERIVLDIGSDEILIEFLLHFFVVDELQDQKLIQQATALESRTQNCFFLFFDVY
jgi:hypothetical protein